MTPAELAAAGCGVDGAAYERLARFVDLLLDENRKLNLTAIRDAPAAWLLHVRDSLAAVPLLRQAFARQVLDLGTGGGIPGIPLACVMTNVHFTLLDATRKKVDAAGRIAAALQLQNVTTVWDRAEDLGRGQLGRGFDAVLVRAVGKLDALVALAAPFLRVGGLGLFFKTVAGIEAEAAAAQEAARKCGLAAAGVHSYQLPGYEPRGIAVYERIGSGAA